MPGAAIRIAVGIRGLGEGGVRRPALRLAAPLVHGRADDRIPEPDCRPDGQQLGGRGCLYCTLVESELPPGAQCERNVAGRLGSYCEEESLAIEGERAHIAQEARFELVTDRKRFGEQLHACELFGGELVTELDERERVALCRRENASPHAGSHRRTD